MFQSPGELAFSIGNIHIHWYGICIACAFLMGSFICSKYAQEKGENPSYFFDLSTYILILGIICARLYYVVFNWQYYSHNLLDIFKIWQGGLAIHGGIIGGLIAGILFTRYKKLSFIKYCDITAIGLVLGQAIGRWGNFFNSEAFGTPTDLPWKLYIPLDKRPETFLQYEYFHPTFLYESLWNFIIFLFLFFVLRKVVKKEGIVFFSYLGLYSIGRYFIESLRTDSLLFLDYFKTAQIVSLICLTISIVAIIIIIRKKPINNSL